jgi:hypothetical protein
MEKPIQEATQYAETRWHLEPDAMVEPALEPTRQAVWQEFLDSVVAGVRKAQSG